MKRRYVSLPQLLSRYKFFALYFLCFTFTIFTSEYCQLTKIASNIKPKFNHKKMKQPSSFHYGFRSRFVSSYNYPANSSMPVVEDIIMSSHSNISVLPNVKEAINQRNKIFGRFLQNDFDA